MSNELDKDLQSAAEQLALALQVHNLRIVFAESCTAGLVSAALGQVPGISQWHCGSAVVYREATKAAWLAIPPAMIEKFGVVSAEVAQVMAAGVLQFTPEAEMSAAITGHLGPAAPEHLDGVAHIAIARRRQGAVEFLSVQPLHLTSMSRQDRQREAAKLVLELASEQLSGDPESG